MLHGANLPSIQTSKAYLGSGPPAMLHCGIYIIYIIAILLRELENSDCFVGDLNR